MEHTTSRHNSPNLSDKETNEGIESYSHDVCHPDFQFQQFQDLRSTSYNGLVIKFGFNYSQQKNYSST